MNNVKDYRICSSCRNSKPHREFGKSITTLGGLNYYCLECARFKGRVAVAKYRKANPQKVSASLKRWYLNQGKEYHRNYVKLRRHNDKQFRVASILRTRLSDSLRANLKDRKVSAVRNLGCTIPYLIKYLEAQFRVGMSWDNYGRYGWHIDHIKPLDSFDLTQESEQKKACHYSNLQPLWATENRQKSNKIISVVPTNNTESHPFKKGRHGKRKK